MNSKIIDRSLESGRSLTLSLSPRGCESRSGLPSRTLFFSVERTGWKCGSLAAWCASRMRDSLCLDAIETIVRACTCSTTLDQRRSLSFLGLVSRVRELHRDTSGGIHYRCIFFYNFMIIYFIFFPKPRLSRTALFYERCMRERRLATAKSRTIYFVTSAQVPWQALSLGVRLEHFLRRGIVPRTVELVHRDTRQRQFVENYLFFN